MSEASLIRVRKVVSGGQTGVDQGALEAAIWLGMDHGGCCPRGRRCETGRIPARFRLRELPGRDYAARTEQNVIDSDGTLILYRATLQGGTAFTRRMTLKHRRPCWTVDLDDDPDLAAIRSWLERERIEVLNVAGPRASSDERVREDARQLLIDLFRD